MKLFSVFAIALLTILSLVSGANAVDAVEPEEESSWARSLQSMNGCYSYCYSTSCAYSWCWMCGGPCYRRRALRGEATTDFEQDVIMPVE